MKRRYLILGALALVLAGCSHEGQGPLSFQSPTDWKVQWKTDGRRDFYALTANTPGGGLLMFSQWPPPTRREQIPACVQKLADQFVAQSRISSGFKLVSETYNIEPFSGDRCEGSYAAFHVATGASEILQAMFLMSVDGRVWQGQFTGTPESWTRALAVLKSIKKQR